MSNAVSSPIRIQNLQQESVRIALRVTKPPREAPLRPTHGLQVNGSAPIFNCFLRFAVKEIHSGSISSPVRGSSRRKWKKKEAETNLPVVLGVFLSLIRGGSSSSSSSSSRGSSSSHY